MAFTGSPICIGNGAFYGNQQVFDVTQLGGKYGPAQGNGPGGNNDYNSVQATIALAKAAIANYAGYGSPPLLYFPPNKAYFINGASPLDITGLQIANYGQITGAGSSPTDCFYVNGADEQTIGYLGLITQFQNGAGLHLYNTSNSTFHSPSISENLYQVLIETGNGGQSSGNTGYVDFMGSDDVASSRGITFKCFPNATVIYNRMVCGPIAPELYGISFETPNVALLTGCQIQYNSVECSGLGTPAGASGSGIWCSQYVPAQYNHIRVNGILYLNNAADINWGGTANQYGNLVEAGFNALETSYTTMLLGPGANVVRALTGDYLAEIAATSTTNSRGTWNGGSATFSTHINFSAALSALANNASQTWYIYSPFLTGSTQVDAWIKSLSTGAGINVTAVLDNNATHPNEIAIVLTNNSGAAYTGTVHGVCQVGV